MARLRSGTKGRAEAYPGPPRGRQAGQTRAGARGGLVARLGGACRAQGAEFGKAARSRRCGAGAQPAPKVAQLKDAVARYEDVLALYVLRARSDVTRRCQGRRGRDEVGNGWATECRMVPRKRQGKWGEAKGLRRSRRAARRPAGRHGSGAQARSGWRRRGARWAAAGAQERPAWGLPRRPFSARVAVGRALGRAGAPGAHPVDDVQAVEVLEAHEEGQHHLRRAGAAAGVRGSHRCGNGSVGIWRPPTVT